MGDNTNRERIDEIRHVCISYAKKETNIAEINIIRKILHWSAILLLVVAVSTTFLLFGFFMSFGLDSVEILKKIGWSFFVIIVTGIAVTFEVVRNRIDSIAEGKEKNG